MIVDMNEPFYSYDKLVADAKSLAEKYNSILQYVTIGKSHDNRDIVMLKLGLGKKYIICCAGVHARETINPIVMIRIVEYYTELFMSFKGQKEKLNDKLDHAKLHLESEYEQMLYGTCNYELLNIFTILFIPLLNPDGYMISLKGYEEISDAILRARCLSRKIPAAEWKCNARGVDLNRNFPSKLWRPKDEGDVAASENETKALINVFHEHRSKGFLDFHSRGNMIYYYRSLMTDKYNEKQFEIASRFHKITNYVLVPPEEEVDNGDSGGNTVHYYSEHFHKPTLTIETVEEIAPFPLDNKYRAPVFEELKLVIFEFGSLII